MRVDASVYPARVKASGTFYRDKVLIYNGLGKTDVEYYNIKRSLTPYNTRPTNVAVYDKIASAPEEFPTIYGYLL